MSEHAKHSLTDEELKAHRRRKRWLHALLNMHFAEHNGNPDALDEMTRTQWEAYLAFLDRVHDVEETVRHKDDKKKDIHLLKGLICAKKMNNKTTK